MEDANSRAIYHKLWRIFLQVAQRLVVGHESDSPSRGLFCFNKKGSP